MMMPPSVVGTPWEDVLTALVLTATVALVALALYLVGWGA